MQEGTRDIQTAVQFRMTYTLIQREPRSVAAGEPLPDIDQFPILNQQEAFKTFEATFEKDCGDNDLCESHMAVCAPSETSFSYSFGLKFCSFSLPTDGGQPEPGANVRRRCLRTGTGTTQRSGTGLIGG